MLSELIAVVEQEVPDLGARWREEKRRAREAWPDGAREEIAGQLLASLGLSHCLLITPAFRAKIDDAEGDPRRLRPRVSEYGGTLLVTLRSFKAGTTTTDDVHEIADRLGDADRVVLDLRLNDGGSGGMVAEAAGLFLPPGTPVLRIRTRAGRDLAEPHVVSTFREDRSADHELEVETIRTRHFLEHRTPADPLGSFGGPVTVIVDRTCYSCGEIFVQAMKEHGRAGVLGQPSAGAVIAAMPFPLTDDYSVLLPFAEMESGLGAVLEGLGVSPDRLVEVEGLEDRELVRLPLRE